MFIDSDIYNVTIILVLLAIDEIVLTKHMRNKAQWLIYLTICNLSHKIWKSRSKSRGIIVGLIPIHKRDFFKVKIEI